MAARIAAESAALTPPLCCVCHAWINCRVHEILEREAQHRRVHPDRLVAELITKILCDRLVDAVLDR